jgi:hypothetical protein
VHRALLIAPALALAAVQETSPPLGSSLTPGTQLLYESNGVTTPWYIDSVNTSFAAGSESNCLRLVLRIGTGAAQTRTHCVVGETMMNWSQNAGRLVAARPLSITTMGISAANGGSVRFEVSPPAVDTIGTERFVVLPTVVTTLDSSGKAIRRLTERFAQALATATEGVFEVPDTARAGQWRISQRFRLTGIRRP